MAIAPITVGDHAAVSKINQAIGKANLVDGKAEQIALASEASARQQADRAEASARQQADSAEASARQKADAASPVQAPVHSRPGEAPSFYVTSLGGGDPANLPGVPASAARADDAGRVVRVVGDALVASRALYPVEPSKKYLVEFSVQRRVNSPDPANDAIRCGLAWYSQTRDLLSQTVVEDVIVNVGAGRQSVSAVVSRAAGVGIDFAAPGLARYVRPFVQTFGTLVQSDVEVIRWTDITFTSAYSPDLTDLEGRVSAQESVDAGGRLNALEAQVSAPATLKLATYGDLEAASVPVSVDIVELQGQADVGDGGGGAFIEEDNGSTDTIEDADGRVWFRAGDVGVPRLTRDTINYLAGSGVLDVRSVCRTEGEKRGLGTISSGSNQLTFTTADVKAGDHLFIIGAAGIPTKFKVQYEVLGSPLQSGVLYIVCDGFIFNANDVSGGIPVLSSDTAAQVATKIRAGSWLGWTVGGSGALVTFERNAAGASLGAHWSDVGFTIIPKTETLLNEGVGVLQAKVVSVVGNVATLDTAATVSVSNEIFYRDMGRPVRLAMEADNSIKEVVVPQGEFFWADGIRFKKSGGRLRGAAPDRSVIYALQKPEILFEFRSETSGMSLLGVDVQDLTINMQNTRRHCVHMSRIWDGSGGRRSLITSVHYGYVGFRVGRDLTAAAPASANDQTVVSQSLSMENFHVIRTNPSQDSSVPVFYLEYVQEGTLTNVKAIGGTDVNGHGVTVAAQFEGCRGLKAVGCSLAGAQKGVRITSVSGESEGVIFVTPTLETNDIAVSVDGGEYAIMDVAVSNPRIIGAGNKFLVAKCRRGFFETQDRLVEIGGGTSADLITIVTDSPDLVADVDLKNTIISHKRSDNGYSYLRTVHGYRCDIQGTMSLLVDMPATDGMLGLAALMNVGGSYQIKRVYAAPADGGRRVLYVTE